MRTKAGQCHSQLHKNRERRPLLIASNSTLPIDPPTMFSEQHFELLTQRGILRLQSAVGLERGNQQPKDEGQKGEHRHANSS
jgi:hypothetical protein